LGVLAASANSVGAGVVNCLPGLSGLNAGQMFVQPRKAYVILGAEPELGAGDTAAAHNALESAELIIALSPFKTRSMDYAHVMLPIAAFAETGGSYVSMEGRLQSFRAAVPPQGEARPAWKVLRVLANQFDLAGFDQDTVEQVLAEALPEGEAMVRARLGNEIAGVTVSQLNAHDGIERLGETPIYQLDIYTRRSPALQATDEGQSAHAASACGALISRLGLTDGKPVKVKQNGAETIMKLIRDDRLPDDVVRVAGSLPAVVMFGPRFGVLTLEKM
jgi:NADH-quinone oxidoreductase subunit G